LQRSRRWARREGTRSRDRGARGSIASAPWEKDAHARPSGREARRPRFSRQGRGPPKRPSDVVKRPGPRYLPHGAQDSVGCPRCASGERSRERARCGCTQFDWVADVGWTRRASSSPVGRKTHRCSRALARKKSVAPLTWGAEGQKAKRRAWSRGSKNSRVHGLRVSACRFAIRRKAFSGIRSVELSPARRSRALWLPDQLRISLCGPKGTRADERTAHRADRIPTRACLQATTRMSEVDTAR